MLAPLRGQPASKRPWEGAVERKPWEYSVVAAIPVMDTPDELAMCIELLRAQSVRPYIVVIDTGSAEKNLSQILDLRADDVEVHCLAFNAVRHPSDFPAIAMDLAMSVMPQGVRWLFATHADCFARRVDLVEWLIGKAEGGSGVAGYEITPRKFPGWEGMVSHTATVIDMELADRLGLGWSQRRLINLTRNTGDEQPDVIHQGWPDTEILINHLLREAGVEPVLIGTEFNGAPTRDENVFHFRSFTAGKLYSPNHLKRCVEWRDRAMAEAEINLANWKELKK